MKILILISCILALAITTNAQQSDFPKLSGPYLGQAPPSDTPNKFLPDLFRNMHSSPVFSPDGKQVYWRDMDYQPLQFMEEIDGIWTKPRSVSFKTSFYKQDAPFITPDGNKLFFISTKPQKWYKLKSNEGIWYIKKQKNDWSAPILVSDFYTHWSFSVSERGNLYFGGSEDSSHDIWFIYKLEYKEGKYLKPLKLPKSVNLIEDPVIYGQVSPFIAPDESYLIFSRKVNTNDQDLFISFQKEDGSWTEAVNLGDRINSKGIEICPVVTPDGKYLFYMRRDCVMWVSAKIIEDLKPKELK
ncbi:MAG: PD40 domain-containing protein [Bacteroidales bacterium]|nr:PD40 domain-containing protein [Bacteroidales bacterium]